MIRSLGQEFNPFTRENVHPCSVLVPSFSSSRIPHLFYTYTSQIQLTGSKYSYSSTRSHLKVLSYHLATYKMRRSWIQSCLPSRVRPHTHPLLQASDALHLKQTNPPRVNQHLICGCCSATTFQSARILFLRISKMALIAWPDMWVCMANRRRTAITPLFKPFWRLSNDIAHLDKYPGQDFSLYICGIVMVVQT